MEITIITDPLGTEYGSTKCPILIGKGLAHYYKVNLVSTMISDIVYQKLSKDFNIIDLNLHFVSKEPSMVLLESWFKCLLKRNWITDIGDITLCFSNIAITQCQVWYAQGTISDALESLKYYLPYWQRVTYQLLRSPIKYSDQSLVSRSSSLSQRIVANSKFTANLYRRIGIIINQIIYPPIDLHLFRPVTPNPTRDYILTYFGKETEYHVIKTVADRGAKIKAFGSRISNAPKSCIKHRNIEVLGQVDDKTLVKLYSNALFTLFPFIHEPFGYIPAESLACGTPVLTYHREGPAEVVKESTGWLVDSTPEMVQLATELWCKRDFDEPLQSRESIACYDVENITRKWMTLIES